VDISFTCTWSYGTWIYNYRWNQCLSPLTFWVRPRSRRGVLYATIYDNVGQWLGTDRWFSSDTPVSSTNKTDRQDIFEILLKVALNIISLNPNERVISYLSVYIYHTKFLPHCHKTVDHDFQTRTKISFKIVKESILYWMGRTNNDLQNNTYKTKDRVTRTPPKTGGELMCSGRVSSSCSTIDTCRV
jgi:hypothetical protein